MTTVQLNRVVVTGLGAITPLGNTVDEYWRGLLAGCSGIGKITHFDASQHACQIAAEVKGFDPTNYMDPKTAKRADRFAQFAIASAQQALTDAQFLISDLNAEQVGVVVGSGVGGIKTMEDQQTTYLATGCGFCVNLMGNFRR